MSIVLFLIYFGFALVVSLMLIILPVINLVSIVNPSLFKIYNRKDRINFTIYFIMSYLIIFLLVFFTINLLNNYNSIHSAPVSYKVF